MNKTPRDSVGGSCVSCGNKRMSEYDVFCGLCRWKFNSALIFAHPGILEESYRSNALMILEVS